MTIQTIFNTRDKKFVNISTSREITISEFDTREKKIIITHDDRIVDICDYIIDI